MELGSGIPLAALILSGTGLFLKYGPSKKAGSIGDPFSSALCEKNHQLVEKEIKRVEESAVSGIENLSSVLEKSLDRIEKDRTEHLEYLKRIEGKLDEHIRDKRG
jgi:hypothetical protein